MFIAGKDAVTKFIEINNRVNGLARQFGLVKLIVHAMTLGITEFPDGLNILNEQPKQFEWTKLINLIAMEVLDGIIIVETVPVNGTESSQ